ncbi:hexamerin 70b-like [Calliopsis andreniformis]|uniref:hexamerin 70b-like n=1 Tax=Calliopsis andreniformis TaxID=337506 RepID=UPI003FCD0918
MKSVLCVLAGLCVLAYASHHESQVADKNHLLKQKAVYELFWHVDQPTLYHSELYQKARSFNLLENVNHFSDKEAVNEFVDLLKHGMLPRGQAFTSMDPEMLHQAVVLFRVLHSAQDFDTFYNVAVWARFNLNELMYIYSLSLAVIHRPDTRFIKLPPLQEILPHFFFNEDVMQKAYNIAMGDVGKL